MEERIANSSLLNMSEHAEATKRQHKLTRRKQDDDFRRARLRANTGKCINCKEPAKRCRCDDRSEWVKKRSS